jgi:flagellar basal body rod protein FlgC
LSDQVVSLLEAKDNYSANLDAVKVADEMQKSTLSVLA